MKTQSFDSWKNETITDTCTECITTAKPATLTAKAYDRRLSDFIFAAIGDTNLETTRQSEKKLRFEREMVNLEAGALCVLREKFA